MSRTQVKHFIDRKLKALFTNGFDQEPVETRIKIIAQAIAWEKVKNQLQDKTEEFDPDNI